VSARRWFAHPWLSVALAVGWLLLQHSVELVHVLSGALIGVVVPRLLHGFLPGPVPMRLLPALRLMLVVVWDVIVSNIVVARLVLGPMSRPQPAWVKVPLDLRNPFAISVLASIITTTPGTVSATIDEEHHHILVHALNCSDPEKMAADIKARYERPLMTIFVQPFTTTGESL
jgi:multicomponent K+:H+ antiporter subunit E